MCSDMRWWWWPYTEFQFSFATLQYEYHNFQMGICLRYHLHSMRCAMLMYFLSYAMDLSSDWVSIEIYWPIVLWKTCPINKRSATLTYKKITHLLLAFWSFCLLKHSSCFNDRLRLFKFNIECWLLNVHTIYTSCLIQAISVDGNTILIRFVSRWFLIGTHAHTHKQ